MRKEEVKSMKCYWALFGAALVLGSGKEPTQNDIRNSASRENPVPGAFQRDPSSNNNAAGGGVLGLSFSDKIGNNKDDGSNSSPGGDNNINSNSPAEGQMEEGAFEDNNNSSFDEDEVVTEAFAGNKNNNDNNKNNKINNKNNNNLIGRQNPSVQVSRVRRKHGNPFLSNSH